MRRFWSRGAVPGVALLLICAVGLGVATVRAARRAGTPPRPAPAPALGRAGNTLTPADDARVPALYATERAGSAVPAGPTAARPDPADARACGTLPAFPAGTAAEIMTGLLTIAPFNSVVIDPRRNGDIDWAMDPYHDRAPTTMVCPRTWNCCARAARTPRPNGAGMAPLPAADRDRIAAMATFLALARRSSP